MPSLVRKIARTSITNGLVGWWPYERFSFKTSGVGAYFQDESGYGISATQQGVGGISVKVGGWARPYSGIERLYVDNPSNSAGVTCGTNSIHYTSSAYTYCMWISSSRASPNPDVMVSQGNTADATNMRGSFQLLASRKLRCQLLSSGVDEGYNGTGSNTYPGDSSWVHMAMTASSAAVVGYYNARIDGTGTGGSIPNGSVSLQWGNNGFGAGNQFVGRMDDCRIYSRALTQGEIFTIMNEAYQPNFEFDVMTDRGNTTDSNTFLVPSQTINMRYNTQIVGY